MMTDTPTFLLLLFALSSYSDGLCMWTKEYKKYMEVLNNTVENCSKACNNNPEYPCCQPLNISEPCNCSYFKTGLSQMQSKEAEQLERRLKQKLRPKCCPSSLNMQCKHLVSQKEFVEELKKLFELLKSIS